MRILGKAQRTRKITGDRGSLQHSTTCTRYRLSLGYQSASHTWMVGLPAKRAAARRSRSNETDAPNPVPLPDALRQRARGRTFGSGFAALCLCGESVSRTANLHISHEGVSLACTIEESTG